MSSKIPTPPQPRTSNFSVTAGYREPKSPLTSADVAAKISTPNGTPTSAPSKTFTSTELQTSPAAPTSARRDSSIGKGKPETESERVQVVLRVRPTLGVEQGGALSLDIARNKAILFRPDAPIQQTEFTFDKILGPDSSQHDVYNAAVKHVVEDVLNGYNGTIMAYGQTGAGKTFTLGNTDTAAIGMIPRAVAEVFNKAASDPFSDYKVSMSYIQIYMELIQDLLKPENDKLLIREDLANGVYLEGVAEVGLSSLEECLHYLQKGSENRKSAFTHMNAHSSRSHAVVMLTVVKSRKYLTGQEKAELKRAEKEGIITQKVKVGKLYMVDLAGSERLKKSKSVGIRADEARSINLSLTTLGMCIYARAADSPHVPFRDSKLTRLLQESLGGNAKTSLVVCVSDAVEHSDETNQTLQFGSRAMCVKNKPVINERIDYKVLHAELLAQLDMRNDAAHEIEAMLMRSKEEHADLEIALQQEREQHQAIIGALAAEKEREVGAVQAQLAAQVELLKGHEVKLGEVQVQSSEMQRKLVQLEAEKEMMLEAHYAEVAELQAKLAEQEARHATATQQQRSELRAVELQLEATNALVATLQAHNEALQAQVQELQSANSVLRDERTTLVNRQSSIHLELTKMQQSVRALLPPPDSTLNGEPINISSSIAAAAPQPSSFANAAATASPLPSSSDAGTTQIPIAVDPDRTFSSHTEPSLSGFHFELPAPSPAVSSFRIPHEVQPVIVSNAANPAAPSTINSAVAAAVPLALSSTTASHANAAVTPAAFTASAPSGNNTLSQAVSECLGDAHASSAAPEPVRTASVADTVMAVLSGRTRIHSSSSSGSLVSLGAVLNGAAPLSAADEGQGVGRMARVTSTSSQPGSQPATPSATMRASALSQMVSSSLQGADATATTDTTASGSTTPGFVQTSLANQDAVLEGADRSLGTWGSGTISLPEVPQQQQTDVGAYASGREGATTAHDLPAAHFVGAKAGHGPMTEAPGSSRQTPSTSVSSHVSGELSFAHTPGLQLAPPGSQTTGAHAEENYLQLSTPAGSATAAMPHDATASSTATVTAHSDLSAMTHLGNATGITTGARRSTAESELSAASVASGRSSATGQAMAHPDDMTQNANPAFDALSGEDSPARFSGIEVQLGALQSALQQAATYKEQMESRAQQQASMIATLQASGSQDKQQLLEADSQLRDTTMKLNATQAKLTETQQQLADTIARLQAKSEALTETEVTLLAQKGTTAELESKVQDLQAAVLQLELDLEEARNAHAADQTLYERSRSQIAQAHQQRQAAMKHMRAAMVIQRCWRRWKERALLGRAETEGKALEAARSHVSALEAQREQEARLAEAQLGADLVRDSLVMMKEAVSAIMTAFVASRKELAAKNSLQQRLGSLQPAVYRTGSMVHGHEHHLHKFRPPIRSMSLASTVSSQPSATLQQPSRISKHGSGTMQPPTMSTLAQQSPAGSHSTVQGPPLQATTSLPTPTSQRTPTSAALTAMRSPLGLTAATSTSSHAASATPAGGGWTLATGMPGTHTPQSQQVPVMSVTPASQLSTAGYSQGTPSNTQGTAGYSQAADSYHAVAAGAGSMRPPPLPPLQTADAPHRESSQFMNALRQLTPSQLRMQTTPSSTGSSSKTIGRTGSSAKSLGPV